MIESGLIGGIKAAGSYIALPITVIVTAIGFQFKRMLTRVDSLEHDLELVARALAVSEAKLDSYKERLDKIELKIDSIGYSVQSMERTFINQARINENKIDRLLDHVSKK